MNAQKLEKLQNYANVLQELVTEIQSEIKIAETKGVFSYPRSKNIRKAALHISKNAKNIRDASLTLFKDGEAQSE